MQLQKQQQKKLKMEILDQKEISEAAVLAEALKLRFEGKNNAVKTDDLLFFLKASGLLNISGQTLRRLLGYIRHHDLLAPYFILSNVNVGYWISKDEAELNSFLNEQLNRMSNQFSNVQALHKRLRHNNSKPNSLQASIF